MHQIEIYGNPVPLNRPRACRRGDHIVMYDSQEKIKQQYKFQIKGQFNKEPYHVTTAIEVGCIFYFPIPKCTSRVKTNQMLSNMIFPTKRPDLDNLIKFILDCMNGIVLDDDSQVIDIRAKKLYGLEPKTVITVRPNYEARLEDETHS